MSGLPVAIIVDRIKFEPRQDKINKVAVRPAKTQISLGIRPVWSESSLSKWRKFEPRHDKTNKVAVRQAKTQISLDIRPGWSESSLGAQSFLLVLSCRGSYESYEQNNTHRTTDEKHDKL